MDKKEMILQGKTALGIEFGSTRIKAVLAALDGSVIATGIYDWENTLANGIWTYSLEEIHAGLRGCYASLRDQVKSQYGIVPETYGAIGISAMMHGYMAFDAAGSLLTPFQTWRNENTQQAADALTELFNFNVPLRWTISHLYQCILDKEEHLARTDYVCTLAAYIHRKLTGRRVIGIGDAAGIFPIDSDILDYDPVMMAKFDELIAPEGFSWKTKALLPEVLVAGADAGCLTEEGAAFLDDSGTLKAGIPLCPPEGDAGTGMVATNSVAPRTGNVSAGTSIFAMLVLEKQLSRLHREIDLVTTPTGFPVAMAHASNGTSDLNAWVGLFGEFAELMGMKADPGTLFEKLYTNSLNGDPDCGGLLPYGYYSGESIAAVHEGRPVFARTPDSRFNLANFMRSHLYTALGAVKLGMDIMLKEEGVSVDRILGHGGLFKTKGVAQRYLAAAVNAPVTVMDTASEGGAWGIAVLAAYCIDGGGMKLEDYLEKKIFADMSGETIAPTPEEVEGFETFAARYRSGFPMERVAIESMRW